MRWALSFLIMCGSSAAAAANEVPSYVEHFGVEHRLPMGAALDEIFSGDRAALREGLLPVWTIQCGDAQAPATGFVLETDGMKRFVTAAHNLRGEQCVLGQPGQKNRMVSTADFTRASGFKDDNTVGDQAYDLAWAALPEWDGAALPICETTIGDFTLPQSKRGSGGAIWLSPLCEITGRIGRTLTTDCRGYYKASGAPLLKVSPEICAAGVFNAARMESWNYEGYAAPLSAMGRPKR